MDFEQGNIDVHVLYDVDLSPMTPDC